MEAITETRFHRRGFLAMLGSGAGYLAMAAAGAGSLAMAGCDPIAEIKAWIPVGLNALQSIVTLLGPLVPPGVAAIIGVVKVAFSDLLDAIQQYQTAPPADTATWLGKIKTFMSDLTTSPLGETVDAAGSRAYGGLMLWNSGTLSSMSALWDRTFLILFIFE